MLFVEWAIVVILFLLKVSPVKIAKTLCRCVYVRNFWTNIINVIDYVL